MRMTIHNGRARKDGAYNSLITGGAPRARSRAYTPPYDIYELKS